LSTLHYKKNRNRDIVFPINSFLYLPVGPASSTGDTGGTGVQGAIGVVHQGLFAYLLVFLLV